MLQKILLIFMAAALCSCATTKGQLSVPDDSIVNKYDLFGTINGVRFDGIGVVPPAASYKVRIESKQDVDLFTITSCHRDFGIESVIETGWFKKKRGYEYIYTPSPGIEDRSSCLLRIGSYNKGTANQNAHAIIDFVTPSETLPATNICNGAVGQAGGVTICQSKIGLIQRLRFPVEATALQPSAELKNIKDQEKICVGKWVDKFTWEYSIPLGECVVAFIENAKPNRLHRHTVIGYTQDVIRGK